MDIMQYLLPHDHLLLASSKRVKALILEEIAIDNQDKAIEHRLLLEARELHLSALRLTQQAFGEMNVQTAKHYGNLGRLYQSMKKFKFFGGSAVNVSGIQFLTVDRAQMAHCGNEHVR
ncbi:amyloid protein-binding protein 2-like [Limulus polyphemus]|uniref:Amyloid protein-binding protein 2-like n=1 Tax=Limulus polyphemus TaxID=6850 RepID=A0ABM1TKK6_LIMPO|nr:amyloid protein-binding protein 2-like [Limulus polyphemus]